ncbi:hypothetical protein BH20ACT8_BH20ACT8_09780 [soil metagenome]
MGIVRTPPPASRAGASDATPPLDAAVERLLTVAREELGTEVTFVSDTDALLPPGMAAVPVTGGDGRAFGHLLVELPDPAASGLTDHEERLVRVLARLLGDRCDNSLVATAAWRQRVSRIRSVLDAGWLRIAYQPIADLSTGEVVGVEALSRFPEPPRMTPDRWFREAASIGLGPDLELLAVAQALEAFRVLPEHVYLSVNVSPEAAQSPALGEVLAGAPLDRLVFEITEHAEVTDYAALNSALSPLRASGLRLAVDDAGAGFASLRHILRMAPDIIKLDISLTRDIDSDSVLRALSYSLAAFASAIDAVVVAEGIEREEELDALRFLGVQYGQGFFLQAPGPLASREQLEVALLTPSIAG